MAMPSLSVFLLLTLSGCIVTYHDFPSEHSLPSSPVMPVASCHQTVEFAYGFGGEGSYGSTWGGIYQWTYSGVLSPVECISHHGGRHSTGRRL